MNLRLWFLFASLASALAGCGGGATIGASTAAVSVSAAPSATASAGPANSAAPASAVPVPTASAVIADPNPSPSGTAAASVAKLARYTIDPRKIFVAGISSGGFAAVQLHLAHSSVFKGAAIYAGGVYWCNSGTTAGTALTNCGGETVSYPTGGGTALYESTLVPSQTYLSEESSLGNIDNVSNVKGQPVYLWSGTQDEVVNPKEMADLNSEYASIGANIHFDRTFAAEHGWESPNGELPCGTLGTPYMVTCPNASGAGTYDSVQTWLQMFLGSLQPRNSSGKLQGTQSTFDQTEFGANAANLSLANTGTVFVPRACASGATCGFVLALHGCLQEGALIGNKWEAEAGIDQWADTNDLVVLYPDTVADAAGSGVVLNPNGCFDWWGYSNGEDANYALKSGAQMSVLYAMVRRVTGVGP